MARVTVAWSPRPREVVERLLDLPEGATVRDALRAAGWPQEAQEQQEQAASGLAVWGRRCAPERVLREGDRVEVLRPLRVDPKVARRERFRDQGARAAGLFARRRAGGKPGY